MSGAKTKFRYHAAIAVAGLITLIGALPVATAAWYLLPILLVPVAITVWAWLAGTDADPDGLVVRALLGRRRIPWRSVAELSADARGRAYATLANGAAVPLPAVTATDLPRLVAASGQRVPASDSQRVPVPGGQRVPASGETGDAGPGAATGE